LKGKTIMRALPFLFAAGLAGMATMAAGAAHAGATVTFINPDKFSDVPFLPIDRDRVLDDLKDHFTKLGQQLPAGQDVKIEVTDVDLAGRVEPMLRGANEIRVLRGRADWPRMHLRYTLTQDGKVVNSGEADLADMSYLDNINQYDGGGSLRYEKQMIDDWFGKTFHVKVRRPT
jgi:hypothetical protein